MTGLWVSDYTRAEILAERQNRVLRCEVERLTTELNRARKRARRAMSARARMEWRMEQARQIRLRLTLGVGRIV